MSLPPGAAVGQQRGLQSSKALRIDRFLSPGVNEKDSENLWFQICPTKSYMCSCDVQHIVLCQPEGQLVGAGQPLEWFGGYNSNWEL